jgi:Tfp pilus assembly protein PilO
VSRTYRLLIGVVVIAAVAGGYWKFLLAPKREQASKLTTEVSVAQAQLDQAKTTLASYQQAKTQYRDNYAKIIRLGKAVPSDDDTRSLLVQLDASAKRSGSTFDTLDVGSGTNSATTTGAAATPVAPGAISAGSYSEMPFSLVFSGSFGTLENFLGRLQRFVTLHGDKILVDGRLMRVEAIDVEPGANGWPALSAKITASTYIVPDATSTAPSGGSSSTSPSTTTTTTTSASTGAAADHRPE